MPRRSIRLRLLLWFGLFLAILIAGFAATAWLLQKSARLEEVDSELARRVDLISRTFRSGEFGLPPGHAREFGPPPAGGHRHPDGRWRPPPQAHLRAPVQLPADVTRQFPAGSYFAVWGAQENRLLAQSGPEMASVPRPRQNAPQTLIRLRIRGTCREAYQFTERNDCILAGADIAPLLAELRQFAWQAGAAGLFVLLAGLGGGWLVSGLQLDSIRRIGDTARRIADGNLAERIPGRNMDRELGQLADVLNTTFARLEAAFERQRQFTADAAHELRTPLAVILAETQSALRRDRSAEEYRETLRTCEETAQNMRRLADSLLLLARLDAGPAGEAREPVDLARLAATCATQFRPLAESRGLQLTTDCRPAALSGQPEQILRVFNNLLMNAIEYNRPGGTVTLATRLDNGQAVVTVTDTGAGIAAADLPHVCERFYRATKSRTGTEGHAGLGLAISKAIVEAHGGRLDIASAPEAGTTVTLRWPAPAAA